MKQLEFALKKLASYFPTKLPSGLTEFHAWADSIVELTGPLADEDSVKFVLSDMIQRTGPDKNSKYQTIPAYIPKNHFVQGLIAAASKQVAGQVFYNIKTKQQEAAQAAKVEATTLAAAADTTEKATVTNGSGQKETQQ